MKYFYGLFLLALLFVFSNNITAQEAGPRTQKVEENKYSKIYYVSVSKGSDTTGNGSISNPWRTITYALSEIKDASQEKQYALKVSAGKYDEPTIQLKQYVDIYGGFNGENWDRDIFTYETVLEGNGKHRIAFGNDNTRIDGFTFRGGTVRGDGGAILCKGVSPVISNNSFRMNKTLGPENWHPKYWHRQANDGGAICISDGAKPVVTNNVFYQNKTVNGRGAGIAINNKSGGKIINNVFLDNVSGLNDPMRSSDGGAISIYKWCNPLIENNVIMDNRSLAHNDGGGVWVDLWCSPIIRKNVFLDNVCSDDAGALFIGGQEHRYARPKDPLPPKRKFYITVDRNIFMGNKNPWDNSGVIRFTMESRGIFSNNLCVFNNGVYFQRCEAEIVNNTMLENFLLIETKKPLKENRVYNNIIWGGIEVTAPAVFSHNDSRESVKGSENITKDPLLKNDGFIIYPQSMDYNPFKFITTAFISGASYKKDALKGRIIKAGNKWGVVKTSSGPNVEIWGDFSDQTQFEVMPTFGLQGTSPCNRSGMKIQEITKDVYGHVWSDNKTGSNEINIGAVK